MNNVTMLTNGSGETFGWLVNGVNYDHCIYLWAEFTGRSKKAAQVEYETQSNVWAQIRFDFPDAQR